MSESREAAVDKRYTADELRAGIARAEKLIGASLDDLVQRYQSGLSSPTPPRYPHRLAELLLRLRDAADRPDDDFAQSNASVAIVEVSGIKGETGWHVLAFC